MSDSDLSGLKDPASLGIDRPERAVAFLTALILVLLGYWFFAPPWYSVLHKISLAPHVRDDLFVAKRLADEIADIKKRGKRPFRLLLVGGSTARELTAFDQDVSVALSRRCGQPVRFINAATSDQSLVEAWSFADALAEHDLDRIIVGINYFRLTESRRDLFARLSNVRLALPLSAQLRSMMPADLRSVPKPEFLSQLAMLLAHKGELAGMKRPGASSGNIPQKGREKGFMGARNLYKGPPRNSAWKRERVSHFIALTRVKYEHVSSQASDLWLEFIRRHQQRKIATTLLVLPMDPSLQRARRLFDPQLDKALERFERAGAGVVDWRDLSVLSARDFYDQQHLLASGRRKLFPVLIEALSTYVSGCHKEEKAG